MMKLLADPALREVAKWSLPSALLAHQIFRRYETYQVSVHLSLLIFPPVLLVLRAVAIYPSSTHRLLSLLSTSFATYLSALGAFVVLYRLSPYHPLARYPGPVWRRISMIPSAFQSTLTGDRSKHIDALHKRYGDVVRIGPNELSIVDPSVINALHGASGVPKGPNVMGGALSEENVSMVGIMDPEEHMRRRRPWSRGLNQSAIKQYEPRVVKKVQQLLQRLQEQRGPVILGKWLSYFQYDMMSDMAFGGGSDLLTEGGDRHNRWSMLEESMVVGVTFFYLPWLGIYVGKIPLAVRVVKDMLTYSRELVQTRLSRGSSTPDLFHFLNNEDQPDQGPAPLHQLVNDGILTIVAGSDTTSTTLNSLFHCILAYPETYARLQAEVDTYYPLGENPCNCQHYRDMRYLTAVINEVLRLWPPVPGGGQRKVPQDAGPVEVGSLHLPPGTMFYIPPWTLHRDARNFVFPTAFWPERWLVAAGHVRLEDAPLPSGACPSGKGPGPRVGGLDAAAFVHNEGAYVPFSYGPMNCPGKGLAMLEMRMVVCAILQRFRIARGEGWDAAAFERGYKEYFTGTRPDVPVMLQVR